MKCLNRPSFSYLTIPAWPAYPTEGFTAHTLDLCQYYDGIEAGHLAILRALAKAEAEQRRKSK